MNVDFIRWTLTPIGVEYVFYHNCPGGDCHLLAVGAEFDMVFSPVDFKPLKVWHKTRFQVVESIEKHGAHKGEYVRMYRPVAKRELTDTEAATYWRMGEDARMGVAA